MRDFADSTRYARQMLCVATALLFSLTSVSSSYANGAFPDSYPRYATATPAGTAAMLRLRIPLGGGTGQQGQSTLTFAAGPIWRDEPASPFAPVRFHNSSIMELGVSLSGQTSAKLGGVELTGPQPLRVDAENRKIALSILAGAATLAVIWALASVTAAQGCDDLSC